METAQQGRAVIERAERVARRHGRGVDEVVHRAQEIGARIERWGLEAEVRRFARDHGLTDDDVWERYGVALAGEEEA